MVNSKKKGMVTLSLMSLKKVFWMKKKEKTLVTSHSPIHSSKRKQGRVQVTAVYYACQH